MAFDGFLKIDGITGECTDSKHTGGWMEIMSYSWGVAQMGSGSISAIGGMSKGKADFSDLTVVKMIDKASPALYKACAEGKHIKGAILELCQASGQKHCFMKYTLSDVIVRSARPGGSCQSTEGRPLEEVSLAYSKIEFEYTPLKQDGTPDAATKSSWNLKDNTGT